MIVVLTEAAVADLVAIGRYIKADNPGRTESFVAELELRCHQLGTMQRHFHSCLDTRQAACAGVLTATT